MDAIIVMSIIVTIAFINTAAVGSAITRLRAQRS
jgi:hypothetical protein